MTREDATIQALMGHIGALEDTIKRQSETIKALEQEPILDKIRAEIVDLGQRTMNDNRASGIWACRDIIDLCEAESEDKRMIDADELLNRIAEKCKTPSLSVDTVNGLCGATAIIYDMLNESGKEK